MHISAERARSEGRRYGWIAAALLFAFPISIPSPLFHAVIGLALVCALSLFVFHTATVVSLKVQPQNRVLYQAGVSLAVPAFLSMYFLLDVTNGRAGLFSSVVNPYFLLMASLIAWLCWSIAGELDSEHPFRGFLIASAVLFVICFFGHHGMAPGADIELPSDRDVADTQHSGRMFGQYVTYLAFAYAGLLIGFRRRLH